MLSGGIDVKTTTLGTTRWAVGGGLRGCFDERREAVDGDGGVLATRERCKRRLDRRRAGVASTGHPMVLVNIPGHVEEAVTGARQPLPVTAPNTPRGNASRRKRCIPDGSNTKPPASPLAMTPRAAITRSKPIKPIKQDSNIPFVSAGGGGGYPHPGDTPKPRPFLASPRLT